jgi:hypothetical protein
MAIIKITTDEAGGYATIDCPPEINQLFHHTSAIWDRQRKAWLIEADRVPSVRDWLRDQAHTVIVDTPDDRPTPQPPSVEQILAALPPPDPAHATVYARGARKVRAAAAAAARLAADQARRDWATAHPDQHPWSPDANRAAMTAGQQAADAIVDALELEDLA